MESITDEELALRYREVESVVKREFLEEPPMSGTLSKMLAPYEGVEREFAINGLLYFYKRTILERFLKQHSK